MHAVDELRIWMIVPDTTTADKWRQYIDETLQTFDKNVCAYNTASTLGNTTAFHSVQHSRSGILPTKRLSEGDDMAVEFFHYDNGADIVLDGAALDLLITAVGSDVVIRYLKTQFRILLEGKEILTRNPDVTHVKIRLAKAASADLKQACAQHGLEYYETFGDGTNLQLPPLQAQE